MNNFNKTLKKGAFAKIAVVLGIASLGLTSCLKDKDYVQPDVSAISVYNASPGSEAFDFILDRIRVDYKTPIGYPLRAGYILAASGTRSVALYKAGKNAITDTISTAKVNLEKDKVYSFFLIGPADAPSTLLLRDSLTSAPKGKASVRFINLSPDAGELNLVANAGTDTLLFSNKNYKDASKFVTLTGNKNYKFILKQGDTQKVLSSDVEIKEGRSYTIWARGLASSTDEKLKLDVKVNENSFF